MRVALLVTPGVTCGQDTINDQGAHAQHDMSYPLCVLTTAAPVVTWQSQCRCSHILLHGGMCCVACCAFE